MSEPLIHIDDIICLESDCGIKYVGTLCNVNNKNPAISLKNVQCYGVEDRGTGILCEPRDTIYKELTFPSENIKSFNAMKSSNPPPPPAPLTDEEVSQALSVPLNLHETIISLTTKSGVRYTGTICLVNHEKQNIYLRDVWCYGIEDKATGVLFEPRHYFFLLLSFYVRDIKSFNVEQSFMAPPALPAVEETTQFDISLNLGPVICLKTGAGIRYIGTICNVNRENNTVSLSDVRSYGVEDTSTGILCEPQDEVHKCLDFNWNDIKSFNVMKHLTPSNTCKRDTNSKTSVHHSDNETPVVDDHAPKSRVSTEKSQDSTACSKKQISEVQISKKSDEAKLKTAKQEKYEDTSCSNTYAEPLDTESSAKDGVSEISKIPSTSDIPSMSMYKECSNTYAEPLDTESSVKDDNSEISELPSTSDILSTSDIPSTSDISSTFDIPSTEQCNSVHHSYNQISSGMQTLKIYHVNDSIKKMQDVSSTDAEFPELSGISSIEQSDSVHRWNDQVFSGMQTLEMYEETNIVTMEGVCDKISWYTATQATSYRENFAFDAGLKASVISTAEQCYSSPHFNNKIIIPMKIEERNGIRHLKKVTQDKDGLVCCSYTALQPFYRENVSFASVTSITEANGSAPHFNDQMFSEMQMPKIDYVRDSKEATQDKDKHISSSDISILPLYTECLTSDEVPEMSGISSTKQKDSFPYLKYQMFSETQTLKIYDANDQVNEVQDVCKTISHSHSAIQTEYRECLAIDAGLKTTVMRTTEDVCVIPYVNYAVFAKMAVLETNCVRDLEKVMQDEHVHTSS